MIDWNYIRENYPNALKKYLRKSWTLEEFWEACDVYVNLRVIEEETGCELWEWKIKSKIVIYSSLCYKTIRRDGKQISVWTFDDIIEKQVKRVFELLEDQIKNKNYLNN